MSGTWVGSTLEFVRLTYEPLDERVDANQKPGQSPGTDQDQSECAAPHGPK